MGILSQLRRTALAWAALLGLLATPAAAGELRVILDAEAGVRGDGNYAQVENVERAEGKEDESIARGGFNLRLSYELPRMILALGYSPSYEWVLDNADNADVNGTTHRLDFGLAGNLTRRLKLNVRERLVSSPGLDLDAPFDQPETLAVTRRGDQLTHGLDVSLAQEITRRTSVLLGAAHSLRTFENEDLADTETLSGRIGLGFQLTPDRRLDVQGTSGSYDFGDGLGTGLRRLGRNGEADVQTLSLGWTQSFLREGQFRAEVGAFSVDSNRVVALGSDVEGQPLEEVRVEEEHTGWRGAVGLSRQLELFNWDLGYRHDVSAGAGFGRAVQVDNAFAGVSTRVGRALVLGLDANGSRHRDLSGDLSDGEGGDPDDPLLQTERARLVESLAGTARFSWRFTKVAALNGGYSYIKQDSQVEPFEDLSYSRYFLGLALQLYRSGEEPRDPADAGETDDDEPDTQ